MIKIWFNNIYFHVSLISNYNINSLLNNINKFMLIWWMDWKINKKNISFLGCIKVLNKECRIKLNNIQ